MMKLILRNFFTVMALLLSLFSFSQVTTSNITGTVKASNGEDLAGATITAIHQPSGSKYTTVSKKGGAFNLPGLRTGGPYMVTIEFVGYTVQTVDGFNLTLGEPYNVNVVMGQNTQQLTEVVVGASTRRRGAIDRTGASTNISSRQLATLPSISRSITDFTRLTPQAGSSVSSASNSFGGRDGRYNNVQVDGANLNNNFGLSTDPLPGGGNNPISLDAIDQISINISPYDVRQANFTGAGINAITKSGTNTFHGSAYTYFRNQSFNGTSVGDAKLATQQKTKSNIYGATLGGPIIKDKLFFFVSGELEERTFPGIQYSPKGGSGTGRISDVPKDSLAKLSNYLDSKFGYKTGAYDNFPNFASKNHKILGRIDWNISNGQKLTVKYNELVSNNDVALNAASIPNSAASAGVPYNTPSFDIGGRVSSQALSFANSNYGFKDVVRSGTVELNSSFKGRMSNQLLGTITKIRSTRTSPSTVFPFIDILNNNNTVYMSAGYEPYSYNNDVINNVYSITDNFSYYVGKHSITAGGSYEFQRVANEFMSASQSYYAFNSLDDFVTNKAPRVFAYTYSLVPGQKAVYSAELKIGQLGFYAQDEINVNPRFKVTAGIRFDRPTYIDQPLANPAISALNLPDKNGNLTHYTTGKFPNSSFYFSPRVGFRWDAQGDKSLVVRGGTGIFTGRIPFVLLTNIPTNSGMYQFGTNVAGTRVANFKFNPNPDAYRDSFPSVAGTSVPAAIALTSPNFKFPQVWRTNLAVDKQLGQGWALTLEALFTKDINAVYLRNANQKPLDSMTVGAGSRPRFSAALQNNLAGGRRLYPGISSAVVLENTNKGESASFTAQVSKSFNSGLYGSIAYTYSFAQDVTANPGSQASSIWSANPTSKSQNDLELSYSAFSVPHRIVGTVSYRLEYIKHLGSTISIFYEGAHQGRYSYYYNGDLNGDGNTSADLIYIPKDPSEITFTAIAASSTTPAFTAQQESDAFFRFLNQDPYLKKHKGQFAERNGALLPFYHRVDMKFLQDIFVSRGSQKHTLQFSLDALNFLNLLSSQWGVRNQVVVNNPLTVASTVGGKPVFRLATYTNNGTVQLVDRTFINTLTTSSTWSIQLGLRYSL